MSYLKEKIEDLLTGKSDVDLKKIIEKLLPARRLSLLPSLIIKQRETNLILLEYHLITGYSKRELKIGTYEGSVFPLSETKILISGKRRITRDEPCYSYDLTNDSFVKLDLPFYDIIVPFQTSATSVEFFINTIGERTNKLKILQFNTATRTPKDGKNPSKFKLRYENLEKPTTETIRYVKRISPQWLLLAYLGGIIHAYYRETINQEYELKSKFFCYGDICDFGIATSNKILIIQDQEYKVYIFDKDGEITDIKFGDISTDSNTTSVCLGSNTIASYTEQYPPRLGNTELKIQSFTGEDYDPHTQIMNFNGRKPVPITQNHFIKIDSQLEIWMRKDEDYFLYSLYPLDLVYGGGKVTPILPNSKGRSSIVKYLIPLIKLPKDLIASTIEFF